MLGNIVKKLRLFGYDTKYVFNIDDNEIISIAQAECRVLLTRDKNLASKAIKERIQSVLLESTLEIDQLIQIARVLFITNFLIDINKARCSICNEKIEQITKEKILGNIPEGVKCNKEFWICKKCDKIYWKGTHIEKLEQFTEMLNEKL